VETVVELVVTVSEKVRFGPVQGPGQQEVGFAKGWLEGSCCEPLPS